MVTQKLVASLIVALMVLGLATGAWADCRKKIALDVAAAGAAIDASGTAEARAQGDQQRFKVSIDARVADGTTFAVYANGKLAGTITIALGEGELDLNNNNGNVLPDGTNPVCGIKTVEVRDANNTAILSGSF